MKNKPLNLTKQKILNSKNKLSTKQIQFHFILRNVENNVVDKMAYLNVLMLEVSKSCCSSSSSLCNTRLQVASLAESTAMLLMQWPYYQCTGPHFTNLGRLSQPHLVLFQQPTETQTQDPKFSYHPPQPLSQHQACPSSYLWFITKGKISCFRDDVPLDPFYSAAAHLCKILAGCI